MSSESWIHIGITVLGWVALIATMRQQLANLEKRMEKVEGCIDEMPKNYVPRTEVERALSSIADTTKQTNAMVQALIYSGGDKTIVRQVIT